MQKKSAAKSNNEKNIESRSDGYSFRVRMKVGETFINETFFSIEEARAYRDLLRAGKSTDKDQEKVLRAKACLLYTSPSPRDKRQSRMPSSA